MCRARTKSAKCEKKERFEMGEVKNGLSAGCGMECSDKCVAANVFFEFGEEFVD